MIITNEEEYEAALDRAWKIFDAKPDTPEMARLDEVCTAIEAYEDEHYPWPPYPYEGEDDDYPWAPEAAT